MKVCTVCKEIKAFDEFYNYKGNKDGKMYRCKPCDNLARKKNKENNLEKYKENSRRRSVRCKYNIELSTYIEMLEKQKSSCAICLTLNPNGSGSTSNFLKHFAIDHCHTTGRVRGLLCNACNRGLGLLQDSGEILQRAINYLTH